MLELKAIPPVALTLVVPPPVSVTASEAVKTPFPSVIAMPDRLIPPVPESSVRARLAALYAPVTEIVPATPLTTDAA